MARLGSIGGRLYRGEVSVNFVGRRKMFYLISGLILVVSLLSLLIFRLNFSVDFKGGSEFEFAAPRVSATSSTAARIDKIVTGAFSGANPTTTVTKPPHEAPKWQVQTAGVTFAQGSRIEDALSKSFGIRVSAITRTFVSSTWGSQISQKALEGLIAFLIVIVIYLSIAFEWRMASAALVALAHDIVITIGVYSLTGFQVSPATVIGLLTILGYSLYDTVVVFDKVRENTAALVGTRTSTYSDAANLALNQTLVRSINTSLIALLPVTSILVVSVTLLGNGELKDLSLVLFVGMLSGTYSSICIATPVLAQLKEREPQYQQLARQVALRAAGGRTKLRKTAAAGSGAGRGRGPARLGAQDDAEPGEAGPDDPDLDGATPQPAGRDGLLPDIAGQDAAGSVPGLPADSEGPDEPVTVGRTSSGQARGPASRPGARQQPRRTGTAKRRPAGKKKRR